MVYINGIQVSSGFSLNSAAPLDKRMMLNTNDRLNLTFVQRWLGMIVFDIDSSKWKILINNPENQDTTSESDWADFSTVWAVNVYNQKIVVDDSNNFTYNLDKVPIANSVNISINWIEQIEWSQFTVDYNTPSVSFENDIWYEVWDIINIRYLY